jgi:hypothetical protein
VTRRRLQEGLAFASKDAPRVNHRAAHASRAGNGAKVRTYDIVANSIVNLRVGRRTETPDPAEAAA